MTGKSKNYKLVLLGDTAVGKSCLATRFVKNEFYEHQEPTIGAAFLTKNIDVNNRTVKFEIWDTAGQERYRSLAPMYYRGAAAAIVVYDITCKDSFNGAKGWVKELLNRAQDNCVIVLAGNKADLESERKVDKKEVEDYAITNKLIHMDTSAKIATNVQNLFETIAKNFQTDHLDEPEYTADIFNPNTINYRKRNKYKNSS